MEELLPLVLTIWLNGGEYDFPVSIPITMVTVAMFYISDISALIVTIFQGSIVNFTMLVKDIFTRRVIANPILYRSRYMSDGGWLEFGWMYIGLAFVFM